MDSLLNLVINPVFSWFDRAGIKDVSGPEGDKLDHRTDRQANSFEAVFGQGGWTDAEMLTDVIENLAEGVVVANREGRFLVFNRVAQEILGMGSIDAPLSEWTRTFGCYTPDGTRLIALEELPLARALKGEDVSDFEMFIRNPNIQEGVLIRTCGRPLRDERGEIRGGVVWFRDVTDLKKTEEHLGRLSNAVEQTADSVFITNREGIIEYVNPAFVTTTGYSRDEALGRTPGLLKSGQHTEKFYQELWAAISTGEVFRGTIINRKKNGGIYWTEQTITPMKAMAGDITHFVSVLKDVTEQRKQLEQEFQIRLAREVQQRYYRETSPQVDGYDIAGAAFPAAETGGDYFDFLDMPDGCLGIAIGDVTGHGFGSALIMAETRAYIRSFAEEESDVGRILTRVNQALAKDLEGGRYVTLLLARLDPGNGRFVYASAGHIPGYLVKPSGRVGLIFESTGVPLGLFPDAVYQESRTLFLAPGDLLAFLTDGVTEAESAEEDEFGSDRVIEILQHNLHASAREIISRIHAETLEFTGDQPPHDDITALVCKVTG